MFPPKSDDLAEHEKVDLIYKMLRKQEICKTWQGLYILIKWIVIFGGCGYIFLSFQNDSDGKWSRMVSTKVEAVISPLIDSVVNKVMPVVVSKTMSSLGPNLSLDTTSLPKEILPDSSWTSLSGSSQPTRRRNNTKQELPQNMKQILISQILSAPLAQREAIKNSLAQNETMKLLLEDPDIKAAFLVQ